MDGPQTIGQWLSYSTVGFIGLFIAWYLANTIGKWSISVLMKRNRSANVTIAIGSISVIIVFISILLIWTGGILYSLATTPWILHTIAIIGLILLMAYIIQYAENECTKSDTTVENQKTIKLGDTTRETVEKYISQLPTERREQEEPIIRKVLAHLLE